VAQVANTAQPQTKKQQKKKDEEVASIKVAELSARAVSEEAAESDGAYSSEEAVCFPFDIDIWNYANALCRRPSPTSLACRATTTPTRCMKMMMWT
jgi:hypothetical protein